MLLQLQLRQRAWFIAPNRTGPVDLQPSSGLTLGETLRAIGSGALTNMSIKGGADGALGVGLSAVVDRTTSGGSAKLDGMLGGGLIGYAGVEGAIPLTSSNVKPTFSVSALGGLGLALGVNADFTVKNVPLYTFSSGAQIGIRVPIPISLSFFLGGGVGGEFDLKPGPSANLGTVTVDNKGNIQKSGPLAPTGPQ